MSSQITLAAPWLGAEEGVGRRTKKNEHEKPAVPCLCYPDHGPVLSGGVGGTEEKHTDEQKGTTPGPALSEGSVGQEKKKARTTLPSPITQETLQTLTLKFRNTLWNPRRKMKIS